jgi:hypothetical protein
MPAEKDQHIRHQVQLPSGKQIEVVYLEQGQPPLIGEPTKPESSDPLYVCPRCAGELVHPLDWSEEGPKHWRVMLRCPECEWTREGVFPQAAVERLDDELDRATGELLNDLKRMTHANMAAEIELFIQALEADLIAPCDF